MDPVDKIWLGKTFRMTDWVLAGYKKLVVREAAISEDEGRKLGLNTAIRLSQIREAVLKADGTGPKQLHSEFIKTVRLLIAREFKLLDAEGTQTPAWASIANRQSHGITLSSEWVHHGRFYMENIIFLVRHCLNFH
jgi:hypothetical protein